jgi:hypothetical protein
MSKINKKPINLGLKILTISAFVLIFMPFNKVAAQTVCGEGGCNYTWPGSNAYGYNTTSNNNSNQNTEITNNPEPTIVSINPTSSNKGSGAKTITITGNGFVPSSVARVNDSIRSTVFIDNSHLLATLTANDMNRNGGFFITVFNPAPEGGYSNAIYFTLNTPVISKNNNNSNYSGNTVSDNNTYPDTSASASTNSSDDGSNLAASAIFGSNSFLPSGLVQWILFAILILLIIILVRRIFGAKEEYEELPMKYE